MPVARVRSAVLLVLLVVGPGVVSPTEASCRDPQRIASFDYARGTFAQYPTSIFTPGVEPYAAGTSGYNTKALHGTFWALGFGDPATGRGIDSGSFAGYHGYPQYGDATWISGFLYPYPSIIDGHWAQSEGIDGCIDDLPQPRCMAVLLSDQLDGDGFFALLTQEAEPHGDYYFTRPDDAIRLAPIPAPQVVSTVRDDGVLTLTVEAPTPTEGLYLDPPACAASPVLGYRVYQQVTAIAEPPPVDRDRDGWRLSLGGGLPGSEPLPPGSEANVTATGCFEGGQLHLAASLVFDSGFESVHLSANAPPVDCGPCESRDTDGDGFDVGACTRAFQYDCDDASDAVGPGLPQVCDGLNNDCLDVSWPTLAGTNEVDLDGDGRSECDGDPCPADPQDDQDADGLCAPADNCPGASNPAQDDRDGDGLGDACDPCPDDPDNDLDADGLCAGVDPCLADPGNDADRDAVCDDEDNCPGRSNPFQDETDGDGVGDACDIFAPGELVAEPLPGSRGHVHAGDIDGDGHLDLLLVTFLRDIVWYRNVDGDGTRWEAHTIADSTQNAHTVFGADMDGDDDVDVLFTAATATFAGSRAGVAWYENLDGRGGAWELHPLPVGTGGQAATAFDVDRNGSMDVVAAQIDEFPDQEDNFFVFFNANREGTAWFKRTVEARAGGAASIVAADIDGDGHVDIVTAAARSDTVAWHRNEAFIWNKRVISYDADGPQQVIVADVNRDGAPDVLSASALDGTVAWYENPRADVSPWSTHVVSTELLEAHSVFAGDIDRDGDVDVVASGRQDGRLALSWYENLNGRGTGWQRRGIDAAESVLLSIHAADLDGDGDLEVISGASPSGAAFTYHNAVCDAPTSLAPVGELDIRKVGNSGIRMVWAQVADATAYDVTRGSLAGLAPGRYGACVAETLPVPVYDDPAVPPSGQGWTYLIRARGSACSRGGLGQDGEGLERVNRSPDACR